MLSTFIFKYLTALQSCTGPVQGQNRVFPVKFSTQGKTCFHYREPLFSLQGPCFHYRDFPVRKTSQGKTCFHYREPCSHCRDGFAVRVPSERNPCNYCGENISSVAGAKSCLQVKKPFPQAPLSFQQKSRKVLVCNKVTYSFN